jgi:hypothetical protein
MVKTPLPDRKARRVFEILWLIIRTPAFLVLYWLRFPVMLLCNFVSFPAMVAFLFALYAFPDKTNMVTALGVVSFGAFAVLYFYDFLLMSLSPREILRTL